MNHVFNQIYTETMSSKRPPCPQCQSKKTVLIHYGMPSSDMAKQATTGKFALGGCCIREDSPKWYCLVCEHEWGKYLPSIDDLESPPVDPQKPLELFFTLGGFDMPGRYCVILEGDTVKYGVIYGSEMVEVMAAVMPSARKWLNFRKKLDTIHIWGWKRRYHNPSVLDGVQWELEINYGIRKLKTYGSNWYPGSTDYANLRETPEFKAFKHALGLLLGGVKIA